MDKKRRKNNLIIIKNELFKALVECTLYILSTHPAARAEGYVVKEKNIQKNMFNEISEIFGTQKVQTSTGKVLEIPLNWIFPWQLNCIQTSQRFVQK